MRNFPVIKFVIIFTIGILFQNIQPLNSIFLFTLIFVLLFVFIIIRIIPKVRSNNLFHQVILSAIAFCVGAFYLGINTSTNVNYPFQEPKIRNTLVVGKVIEIDLIKNNKLSAGINLISINNKNLPLKTSAKFISNFYQDTTVILDSIYKELKIGNTISFVGTISQPRNQRNPGEFDYEEYLSHKGISGIISCYKLESIKIIDCNVDKISNLIFNIRKSFDYRIKELHDSETSGLLKGILLADRADIEYDIKESFINSGVIHVLAVSGLHVGFISVIFFLILGRFDIRVKYIMTIIGITIFLIITGGHPSVFRASIMAIIYLVSRLSNRSTNGFNSISIAALIILVINPLDLFNPGFLLSFSAVISILIIYPIFSKRINNLQIKSVFKKLLLFISVSLAAQLGTLPFTLIYFNKLSIVSLFANLIVIPVIGIIVSIGIITLVSSSLSLWIASIFASANMLLTELLYYFVKNISNFTYSFMPIYNFSIIDGLLFYMFLTIILFSVTHFNKKYLVIIITISLLLSLQNYFSIDDKLLLPDGELSVLAIDVGQGDSFLIKLPNGETALIDAGEATEHFDNGERVIYPLLQRLLIDKIDYAFISHLDSDHFAGLISLIKHGIIGKVYKPINDNSIKDSIFEDYLYASKIEYNYYSNKSIALGQCKIYFLNDTSNIYYKNFDSNNKSGILKIVYGKTSFLFVGDAEMEAEEYLIERYGSFLESDVLKIGHHGSKSSSSNSFLDIVKPKIGIISAGIMNKFKHPSPVVLNKFKDRNIEIKRTDFEGAILFTSDGELINNIEWRD